jgi:hypothetical protein
MYNVIENPFIVKSLRLLVFQVHNCSIFYAIKVFSNVRFKELFSVEDELWTVQHSFLLSNSVIQCFVSIDAIVNKGWNISLS